MTRTAPLFFSLSLSVSLCASLCLSLVAPALEWSEDAGETAESRAVQTDRSPALCISVSLCLPLRLDAADHSVLYLVAAVEIQEFLPQSLCSLCAPLCAMDCLH